MPTACGSPQTAPRLPCLRVQAIDKCVLLLLYAHMKGPEKGTYFNVEGKLLEGALSALWKRKGLPPVYCLKVTQWQPQAPQPKRRRSLVKRADK